MSGILTHDFDLVSAKRRVLEIVSDYITLTNRSPTVPRDRTEMLGWCSTRDTATYGEKLTAGQPHPDHWMRYREKHIRAPAVACQTTGDRSGACLENTRQALRCRV